MSACRDERPCDHPDAHEALPPDLLKDAAELRAAGYDWMEVAAALGRNHYHLRLACRRDPRFAESLEDARREVLRETEAEMLRKLREHMRSEDERVSADAAERLVKYLTAQRNCDTRLQVEEVKKGAKIEAERIKAGAKAAKHEPREEAEELLPMTDKEREHYRDCQCRSAAWAAEQQARGEAAVFLWGGCHKLGGTLPDETDTPLYLTGDSTIGPLPDGRRVFWVVPMPPPVPDPTNGPFLQPPGCRPATCPRDPEASGAA